mgnify:CR=1 FL=1
MRPPNARRWDSVASRTLKALLAQHGLSYADLVARLNADGASESYASVANKLSRGTFSFAFYLQCVAAIESAEQQAMAVERRARTKGNKR